ncbi:integrase arm-type DNA-binding domain-containing protein [Pseudomonadota bacterium]
MPKVVKPLSDTQIRQAKPKEKEYNLSDGLGLQLRVKPSGTKVWLFNYTRPQAKKRTNFAFGRYPAIKLSDARRFRDEAQSLLSKGIDPAEFKSQQEADKQSQDKNTLEHVCGLWFSVKENSVTPDYATDIWRSFELHVFPKLGDVPIVDIRPVMVIKALSPLSEKGSLETVKRVCQRLNEVMVFAVNTGLIEVNFLSGIKNAFRSPKAVNMPTLKPKELGQLLVDLHNANIRRTTRLLIQWQLHTMARPSEASGARWSEIDYENRVWNIPAERMKKKIPHTVPLTDSCF